MTNLDNLSQLVEVIAEATGNDAEYITEFTHLEDDLGVVLDEDFQRLIVKVNAHFNIKLDPTETSDQTETVGDLLALVNEETELS